MSVAPPGANGTTRVSGRSGYSARATPVLTHRAKHTTGSACLKFTRILPSFLCGRTLKHLQRRVDPTLGFAGSTPTAGALILPGERTPRARHAAHGGEPELRQRMRRQSGGF